MLQAAASALFSTRSTPVWTMRGVYRQDAAQDFPEVSRGDIDLSSCFD